MKVGLLPIGDLPRGLLRRLSDRLASSGIVGEIRPPIDVPEDALDGGSAQLRSEVLVRLAKDQPGAVLAVTSEDLGAEGYDFVFGFANIGAPGAVVSLARLRDPHAKRFLDRVVKEALHELGHTWGLPHCESPACVMRHSESIEDADAKGERFCVTCRGLVPSVLHDR